MSQKEVLLPLMGEGVNEATVIKWLKQPGDPVDLDEPIVEVSTDKVDTEIPSTYQGFVIEQKVKEGETVRVHEALALIGDHADDKGTSEPHKPEKKLDPPKPEPQRSHALKKVAPSQSMSAPQTGSLKTSPVVRKIAKDMNIELEQIKGTGVGGRITKKDLDRHLALKSREASTIIPAGSHKRPNQNLLVPTEDPEQKIAPTPTNTALQIRKDQEGEFLEGVKVERKPMSRMRRLIAHHMVESVRTSPHVTTVFEVDVSHMVEHRKRYKDRFLSHHGLKLTYTPYLIHAAVKAIKLHPIVNTSLDGDDVLFKKDINISCAVALEDGLIVPVIKKAGELNLEGIALRLHDLVERARTKKLKPEDVKGGTFSITNPGGFGSLTSNPIINQPQVAILGIGAIIDKPVAIEGAIAIRPMMMVSLTFDHRVIDGEGGACYLRDLKRILEEQGEPPL